jgi:hypothetical protein
MQENGEIRIVNPNYISINLYSFTVHLLTIVTSPTNALDISCSPYKTYNYVKYIKI